MKSNWSIFQLVEKIDDFWSAQDFTVDLRVNGVKKKVRAFFRDVARKNAFRMNVFKEMLRGKVLNVSFPELSCQPNSYIFIYEFRLSHMKFSSVVLA